MRHRAEALAAKLPPLQVEAYRVAATVAHGFHGRRRAGIGETFWQFRPYQPFDSVRAIDWRRSAKGQHVFVREREWEAAQSVWIWRDASPSMTYSSSRELPDKRQRAEVLALALAALLVEGGENIAPLGEGMPARGGRPALDVMANLLATTPPSVASLPPVEPLPRHSLLVLISDFMQPVTELRRLLAGYADRGVSVVLLQVTDPAEESFPFRSRIRFAGPEAEAPHLLSRADAVREDYVGRMAAHRAGLRELARRAGWWYQHHSTDQTPETALLTLHARLAPMRR